MPKNVQIGPLNLCQRSNMLSAHVRCQAAMPMPSLGAWSPAFGCPSAGWAGGRWAVAPLHCPDLGRFPCGRRPWGDGATPGPEETQKRAPPTPGTPRCALSESNLRLVGPGWLAQGCSRSRSPLCRGGLVASSGSRPSQVREPRTAPRPLDGASASSREVCLAG